MSFTVRLRAFSQWLFREEAPGWLVIAPVALIATAWIPYPALPELRVRIAGFAICMLGVALVVHGIKDKTRAFSRPTMGQRVRAWLDRQPQVFGRQPAITGVAGVSIGMVSVSGSGTVTARGRRTSTVEDRVAELEEDVRRINERIAAAEVKIQTESTERRRAIEEARASSEEAVRKVSERLEDLSVGGLNFEAVGVAWLIVGNVVTTFPDFIAKLI